MLFFSNKIWAITGLALRIAPAQINSNLTEEGRVTRRGHPRPQILGTSNDTGRRLIFDLAHHTLECCPAWKWFEQILHLINGCGRAIEPLLFAFTRKDYWHPSMHRTHHLIRHRRDDVE
jgi:hypothetical protein